MYELFWLSHEFLSPWRPFVLRGLVQMLKAIMGVLLFFLFSAVRFMLDGSSVSWWELLVGVWVSSLVGSISFSGGCLCVRGGGFWFWAVFGGGRGVGGHLWNSRDRKWLQYGVESGSLKPPPQEWFRVPVRTWSSGSMSRNVRKNDKSEKRKHYQKEY